MRLKRLCLALVALAALLPVRGRCASARGAGWGGLERRTIQALAAWNPVDASQKGLHRFDGVYADFTPGSVVRTRRLLRALLSELEARGTGGLSRDQRLDRELLIRDVRVQLRVIEVERPYRHTPALYVSDLEQGIQTLLEHPYGPVERQVRVIDQRLQNGVRLLKQAQKLLVEPPQLLCRISSSMLRDMPELLDSAVVPLAAHTSLVDSVRIHVERLELEIAGFREYLGEEEEEAQVGKPRRENYALGEANYSWRLKNAEGLSLTGGQLAALGERWLSELEAARDAIRPAGGGRGGGRGAAGVTAPPGFGARELRKYYVDALDSLKDFVRRKDLVTIPADIGPLIPTPTPHYMRAVVPGPAMEPPLPFDTTTVGVYYLGSMYPDAITAANRDSIYSGLGERRFLGAALHEGYPGHHLQLSVAKHHGSPTRKYSDSTVLVEGWALYCEELMAQQGLWGSDTAEALNRVLPGMIFRATRVVIDARLHCGTLTYEEAVQFMMRHNRRGSREADSARAVGEVSRYVIEPTQAMSYLVGKSLILGIKEELKRREGARFSLKEFHDHLLSYGSIPVPWIARDWIGFIPPVSRVRDRW